MIEVINPANAKRVKAYDEVSSGELSDTIDSQHNAWSSWKQTSFEERAELMKKLGSVFREEKEVLATIMAEEMGKPMGGGISEAEKCAWVCDYYAENAEQFLSPTQVETEAQKSYISYQPLGLVLAIMPWNFPFWQVMRFAAPAVMAGNVGILKHATNVPDCAQAVESLFHKAGFPEYIFKNVLMGHDKIEEALANPKVKAVTLTGSTRAGKSIAALAGKYLKKSVLELGGSDPYVILADADIENAAEACVNGRMINNGQSCIAAKRFIVVKEVREKFEKLVVEKLKAFEMGNPMDKDTKLGPMAREDLRDGLHDQVKQSVEKGAKVVLGGKVPDLDGFFYPATLLTDVPLDAPAFNEELFGPVACLVEAENEEEAIGLANHTSFGLGAAVFTSDIKKGAEIAEKKLEAGCCFVNDFVKSDPRLPFGGVKESGYGRELSSLGIKEFVNAKTVYIK